MDVWIPLLAAAIAALSALGVAIWSGRGETATLRTLKLMNEVLEGIDTETEEKLAFRQARDVLLIRVATRIESASRRARVVWIVLVGILTAGIVIGALLLVTVLWGFNLNALIAGIAGATMVAGVMLLVYEIWGIGVEPSAKRDRSNPASDSTTGPVQESADGSA